MSASEDPFDTRHLLVVIDHHEARVFRTQIRGTVPVSIFPYDPYGHGRHLHSANQWTDGKSPPERKSYYEAVARTLSGAEQILLFGSGTGKCNAMDQLLSDLAQHHANLAERVIGSVVIDPHHLTEAQLLARAREFYAIHNRRK